MDAGDRDLLRPTLDRDFDVARVAEPPWNPSHLIWGALFGGPFGGGLLYSRNYERLGDARKARLTLAIAVGLAWAYATAIAWYLAHASAADTESTRLLIRRIGMLVFVGSAMLVRRDQNRVFEAYENAGRPVAKAFPAVVLAVLANIAIMIALVFVMRLVFGD